MSYSLTFARVALGSIVFAHGLANAFGLFGGPGIDRLAAYIETDIGTAPRPLAYAVAYGQLFLGLSLLLGPFAKISALLVLALLVVHFVTAARYQSFFLRNNGFEYLLAVAALCVVVAVHGPGRLVLKIRVKKQDRQ